MLTMIQFLHGIVLALDEPGLRGTISTGEEAFEFTREDCTPSIVFNQQLAGQHVIFRPDGQRAREVSLPPYDKHARRTQFDRRVKRY